MKVVEILDKHLESLHKDLKGVEFESYSDSTEFNRTWEGFYISVIEPMRERIRRKVGPPKLDSLRRRSK